MEEKARRDHDVEVGFALFFAGIGIMLIVAFGDGSEAVMIALGGPVLVAGVIQVIRNWS